MQVPKIDLNGDRIQNIRNLLKIYSIVLFKEEITNREVEVLAEYLTYGCGEKGNKAIELNYGIATNNIRQISSRLQKKGLLIPKHYKEGQGRELHPDLKSVRDNFVTGDHKFLLLQVWK